jgi:hypothetical protein
MQAIMRAILHAMHITILLQQFLRPRAHDQPECRIRPGCFSNTFQKMHLRDDRNVGIARLQLLEFNGANQTLGRHHLHYPDLSMLQLEHAFRQTKLIQHLHRRRMHCIAAKIAREIDVLLQQRHLYTLARQQQCQHHARWSPANDTAGGGLLC